MPCSLCRIFLEGEDDVLWQSDCLVESLLGIQVYAYLSCLD